MRKVYILCICLIFLQISGLKVTQNLPFFKKNAKIDSKLALLIMKYDLFKLFLKGKQYFKKFM